MLQGKSGWESETAIFVDQWSNDKVPDYPKMAMMRWQYGLFSFAHGYYPASKSTMCIYGCTGVDARNFLGGTRHGICREHFQRLEHETEDRPWQPFASTALVDDFC